MSLRQLPKVNCKAPVGIKWDTPIDAMEKWDSSLVSASADSATITIYDAIGSDGWSEGVTAKRISAALRSIGDRDVTVSINSPGGDFFEGIAIYNLLREHPHKITVKVVGLAASAASVIAMAGDERLVAKTGFLMIHNAWAYVVGNRHDLTAASATLEEFDSAMASLYADIAGVEKDKAAKLMDDETWMSGQAAFDTGFATGFLPADEIVEDGSTDMGSNAALRKVEMLLAQQGITKAERRNLLKQIKGGTSGAAPVMSGADLLNGIAELTKTIRGN